MRACVRECVRACMRAYMCEPVCVRECACVCLHPFNMSVWRMWTDLLPQYLPSVVSELLHLFLEVGEVLWQDGQPISLLPCSSGGIFYIIRGETPIFALQSLPF